MIKKSVTFDSNVWESIVDTNKRQSNDWSIKLHDLIINKTIKPYFFEGLATYEAIKKRDRIKFFKGYDGSPIELTPYLQDKVPEANAIGFKFLRTPRIRGLTSNFNDFESNLASDDKFEIGLRQERTFKFGRFIEGIGCGRAHVKDEQIQFNLGNEGSMSDSQFIKGVAEWADGDALSAHYGYGIDIFCTNDKASGAGTKSIFSVDNKALIINKFGIIIMTPDELLSSLE